LAAKGTPDPDTSDPGDDSEECNIWTNSKPSVATWSVTNQAIKTGTATSCVSDAGAYDLIGNVWEWTDNVINNGLHPATGASLPAQSYITGLDVYGLPTTTGSSTADYNYDHFWINATGYRGFIRGGHWNDASNAGLFALNLDPAPSTPYNLIGFRCALTISPAITPKLQKGLILDMPLAEPYTEANDTITKDRTPQGNDGTVSGATIKYDGLVNGGAGVAYINQDKAYGTWEFDVKENTGLRIYPIMSTIDDSGDGYRFRILSTESVQFGRYDSGSHSILFATIASYVDANTDYRIKITRSLAGVFTVYIKGGSFGWDDWTTVVADSGTNPVTDTTYTTSSYFVADLDNTDTISNLKIDGKRHSLNKATVSTGTFTTTGPAYEFDGTDDYIDIGADNPSDLTGDITISAWINPEGWGQVGNGRIIDNGRFKAFVSTVGDVRFFSTTSPFLIGGAGDVTLNTWTHFLITRPSSGTNTNLYINGVLSGNANQDSGTPAGGTTNTFIGNNEATTRTFDGQISNLKIYNRVLSTDEIDYLYSKERVKY